MMAVAQMWYEHRPTDFVHVMQEAYEGAITQEEFLDLWEDGALVNFRVCDGKIIATVEYALLPFDELVKRLGSQGFDSFGVGGSFFDIFAHPEAGLNNPDDPDNDYQRLLKLFDTRSQELAAKSTTS